MKVARTRAELRDALAEFRSGGVRLALVPTMGYLHEGHLSLVDRAADAADLVAASIFVNPLQFAPSEDYETYPRDEQRDLALLRDRGVHLVFVPDVDEMYPGGPPRVRVEPGELADRLCGAYRPGHFSGVLTVVAKLFGLVRPDVAVFGRKDFQQAVLIRRMVTDLDMGVEVVTGPVVREPDGLAMSSRNRYLGEEERAQAAGLHRALERILEARRAGEEDAGVLLERARAELARHPLLETQYLELVHPETLDPVSRAVPGSVAAAAVFCGDTRLIDNEVLDG